MTNTLHGYELAAALKLNGAHVDTCSKIARHARSYERVQEAICNGHPIQGTNAPIETVRRCQEHHDAWCAKREAQLEKRIRELAATLPGVKAVSFAGDPRGCTVKLLRDQDRTDDFSSDGVPVPSS